MHLWVEAQRVVLVVASLGTRKPWCLQGFYCHFLKLPWFLPEGIKITCDTVWKRKSQNFSQFFPNKHLLEAELLAKGVFIRSQGKLQITQCLYQPCQCLGLGFSSKLEAFSQRPFNLCGSLPHCFCFKHRNVIMIILKDACIKYKELWQSHQLNATFLLPFCFFGSVCGLHGWSACFRTVPKMA